jgi:hypothetical protein
MLAFEDAFVWRPNREHRLRKLFGREFAYESKRESVFSARVGYEILLRCDKLNAE